MVLGRQLNKQLCVYLGKRFSAEPSYGIGSIFSLWPSFRRNKKKHMKAKTLLGKSAGNRIRDWFVVSLSNPLPDSVEIAVDDSVWDLIDSSIYDSVWILTNMNAIAAIDASIKNRL